jgi:hypothetical protein
MTDKLHRYRLEGLEADNLMAFLTLLGLLRALETSRPQWRPRAGWDFDYSPLRALLFIAEVVTSDVVCEAAAEDTKEGDERTVARAVVPEEFAQWLEGCPSNV